MAGRYRLSSRAHAARFLSALLAERGVAIAPGQWISSGAVTCVHRVVGDKAEAVFDGRISVECAIKAA